MNPVSGIRPILARLLIIALNKRSPYFSLAICMYYETGGIFVIESESYNAEVFLSFLKDVLKKYPKGKIALVLDNARIHHAKLIQPFLEENKNRLELHFLPPYSPNLNCIEKFWGWLKKSCIYLFITSFSHLLLKLGQQCKNL
jgi:transposase